MPTPDEKPPHPTKHRAKLRSPPNGGKLQIGNPGNSGGKKGRSGPKSSEFKAFCAQIADSPEFQQHLADTAKNPTHRQYMGAVKVVAAYAVGLPVQTVALSGELDLNVRDARERLANRLLRRFAATARTRGRNGDRA